jgi:hypothetical protein
MSLWRRVDRPKLQYTFLYELIQRLLIQRQLCNGSAIYFMRMWGQVDGGKVWRGGL